MDNLKYYGYILTALLFGGIIVHTYRYVLPIMSQYEYVVDKYGNIHDKNCAYYKHNHSYAFKRKYNKYDILIEKEQELCSECLLYEKEKLWALHYINLEELVLRYRRGGATDDYINQVLDKYITNTYGE